MVVEGQNVALRSECVVSSADRGVAIDAGRRSRNTRLRRWWADGPNVEVLAMLFEWRRREQCFRETARVRFKLLRFRRCVTVAEDQEVDTRFGLAGFLNRDERRGLRRFRPVDKLVRRIDRRGPNVLK